jgi:DNA-binding NtrC family response regulator
LFLGEPGSGREAFARYLHAQGPHAAEPFVTVVASALRDRDFELALFGKADDREPGLLEQAGEGTLFINELTDLPWEAQRALLGLLESGSFTRLGESTQRRFRARVMASAEPQVLRRVSSLESATAGAVRRDLLDRLGGLMAEVPSLRDYAEDVPELLRFYVDHMVDAEGLPFRRFGVAAQNRLRNYPWPGNVLELRSLVRRLLLQGGVEEISLEEIEKELSREAAHTETLVKQDLLALSLREAREHFERSYLQQQLQLCHGKVGQLAKRVGMERTHLYRKLRALGVDFRGGADDDT